MIKTRIGIDHWNQYSEELQTAIKSLCREFNCGLRFDYEFSYYEITWTEENWLLAQIKDSPSLAWVHRE